MASLTNAYKIEILNGLTGNTPLTTPLNVYLALFTSDPTDTGSVAGGLSGDGYSRASLGGLFPGAVGVSGIISNDKLVVFSSPTVAWTAITHIGFMKSGVQGVSDMIAHSALNETTSIPVDDVFVCDIGTLVLTVG